MHEAAGWSFLHAARDCDDREAAAQARSCRHRAAEMFERALERGEADAPRSVVGTLIAELWRLAGCFDEALEVCEAAEHDGAELEDDDRASAATVLIFIRSLSLAADDEARNCAQAFAEGE